MDTALLLFNTVLLLALIFLLRVTSSYTLKEIEKLRTEVSIPANENKVAQPVSESTAQFSEDDPVRLNGTTKYEVEGGDSTIPPEYA